MTSFTRYLANPQRMQIYEEGQLLPWCRMSQWFLPFQVVPPKLFDAICILFAIYWRRSFWEEKIDGVMEEKAMRHILQCLPYLIDLFCRRCPGARFCSLIEGSQKIVRRVLRDRKRFFCSCFAFSHTWFISRCNKTRIEK